MRNFKQKKKQISAEALSATAEASKEQKREEATLASSAFRLSSAPRVAISAESASTVVAGAGGTGVGAAAPSAAASASASLPLPVEAPPPPLPLSPATPRPRTSKTPESEAAIQTAMDSLFLFKEMDSSQRKRVVAAMERRYVEAGDTVIR